MTPFTPRKTALAFLALAALGLGVAADGVPHPAAVDAHGDPLPAHTRLRLGTLRFRQGGTVTALFYLADHKTLVSTGDDQTVRFWDADTGRELRHFQPTAFGTLSAQGTRYAAIEADITKDFPSVRITDTITGKPGLTLSGKVPNSFCNQVLFTPDGKVLAAVEGQNDNGSASFTIRLWDPATGQELHHLRGPEAKEDEEQPPFQPADVRFSPDSRTLMVLSNTQQNQPNIRLFDVASGRLLPDLADLSGPTATRRLQAPLQQTTSRPNAETGVVLFSPDGKLLAAPVVTTRDGDEAETRVSLWSLATGARVRDLGKFSNGVGTMLFAPNGKTLAVQQLNDATVHLFDVASGKELDEATSEDGINALAFSPDGQLLALGDSTAQTVILWDVAAGKERHLLKGFRITSAQVLGNGVNAVNTDDSFLAFAPDGKTLFGAAGALLRRWQVADGQEMRLPHAAHDGSILGVALSADGTRLATVSSDNTARLWDAASGKEINRFEAPPPTEAQLAVGLGLGIESAAEVALSPDGRTLAVGWGTGLIQLFDTSSGKELRSLANHVLGVHSLAFAPNGKVLVSAAVDGRVLWWDVAAGKLLRQFAGTPIGDDGDMDNGAPLSSVGIALAPDGRTLAIASAENEFFKLQLWETTNGKMRREFRVKNSASGAPVPPVADPNRVGLEVLERAELPSVVFTPDSKALAWTVNNNIRLWDVVRGEEVRRFGLAEGNPQALAFSPDGKYLTAASSTGGIYVWETATGTVLGRMQGHRGGVVSTAFASNGMTMASGGADTTVLLWDLSSFLAAQRTAPGELSALQLKDLWNRLADEDSERAHEALRQLSDAPRSTVPLLRGLLRPETPVGMKRLTQLLDQLEDDRFAIRKKATEELEKLGEQAEPILQKRLDDNPPLEVKMRVEQLLQKLNGPVTLPERLRGLRALEVLERIGTPEAQEVLRSLTTGAHAARFTQEARMALERLAKQP